MDFERLASELVRCVRGRRSQVSVSQRLGYTTNVVYTWESGRSFPSALSFLELAQACRVPVRKVLSQFYVKPPLWLSQQKAIPSRAVVAAFLRDQRGSTPIGELAQAAEVSRFALARWLKGSVQPSLPDFLRVVHVATQRLLGWVKLFADPEQLPSLAAEWRRQNAARCAAYEQPWSQAVLRALELAAYRALERHQPGWIAARLGISEAREREALALLAQSGQIVSTGGLYTVNQTAPLNLRDDPGAARAQRAFWVQVAAERASVAQGMFAYNVCGVSAADLGRLKQLQRDYLQRARAIIAASEPVEHVALLGVQLFALDEPLSEGV